MDVSVALEDVIVKLVPADRAETRSQPGVPPSVLLVKTILLLDVTFESDTVTDPDERVAVPCLIFDIAVPDDETVRF